MKTILRLASGEKPKITFMPENDQEARILDLLMHGNTVADMSVTCQYSGHVSYGKVEHIVLTNKDNQ